MDFYCHFVSFLSMTYDSYLYGEKKITYQGIARHLSFWWVWGFSFW